MKFKKLRQTEDKRNQIFQEFEEALKKFRLKYSDVDFDLNYADTDHIIVLTENILEYTEEMHVDLCRTFDVKLTYVNKLNQQSSTGHYLTIEYIYQPITDNKPLMKWSDIKWM